MKEIRINKMMNKWAEEDNRNNTREDKKMKTTTIEIINKMTAFKEEKYTRVEMINELFKLQDEMTAIAFGGTQVDARRFYDISDHFADLNRVNRKIPIKKIEEFRKECGEATNCIRAEISGRKGENKTFYKLNLLKSEHQIRKNVEIGDGTKRTEIDALIVTEKAAFIIEVKNSKRDIFIDEHGQYYRTGEFLKWDCDLGKKLEMREEFVRKAAEKSGIQNLKVVKIVVFTDNRMKVQNKYKSIKTCFLSNLTSIIDTYDGEKMLTLNEMDSLMKSVDEITTNTKYAPSIDIQKFKKDFAEIVTAMDNRKAKVNKLIWLKNWRTIVSSITARKVAAFLLTIGTVATIITSI